MPLAQSDPRCAPNGCEPSALMPASYGTPVQLDPRSILNIIQALAKGPPVYQQPVPRLEAPYNADQWNRYAVVVVNPNTATGDAGALLGATALATAEGAARFATISQLTPASIADYVSVFTEQMPDMTALRVKKLGVRVHSSMRALRFVVTKNGVPINPGVAGASSLYEFSDFGDVDDPIDVYIDVQPLDTIAVMCKNLDVNGGYLTEVRLEGHRYSTMRTGPSDSQATEINRQIAPGGRVV